MASTRSEKPMCPDCGLEVGIEQRFCHECGAKLLSPPSRVGERRPLTVVRCRLDLQFSGNDEERHDVVARFLDLAQATVGQFDGVITEQSGTGFLAVFGVPVPHEDHARRGALAALAFRTALGPGLGGASDSMSVTFGVATGDAVVGTEGSRVLSIVGAPVDVTGELAAIADDGAIVADSASEEAMRGYIVCEPLPVGDRPQTAFSVVGEGSRVSRLDRPDQRVTRFVGRRRQLTILGELLDEARAGRGQVVGVTADAGMGKSRLIAEFLSAAGSEIRIREGRCLSYASGTPFVPIVDLLRSQTGATATGHGEDAMAKVRRRLEGVGLDTGTHAVYLANLLGSPESDGLLLERSPEAIREGTFEALVALFVAEAAEAPTIVLIEDVHWIDPVSQEVIGRLVQSLPGRRAILLCTHRPGYRAPWMDVSYATQLALPPLNADASRELAESIIGANPISSDLLDAVVVRADGNPFFLEELSYGLAVGAVGEGAVPATVHDVLSARINQLDSTARGLLRTAAVLGREFPRELLAEIWQGDGEFNALLEVLRTKEFLFEEDGRQQPTMLFRHALTHDVAYSGLLATRRRELHRDAGKALERLWADRLDEVAGQLGYHFSRAGDHVAAVSYLERAANRASQAYSNESAAEMLELALRHVEETQDPQLRQQAPTLVFRLAFTFYLLGRFRDGLERLQSPLAKPHGDEHALIAEHEFWLSYFHTHLGNSEEAHSHAERAIAEAEGLGDAFTAGRAYYVLTREDFWLCRYAQGIEHGRRAVDLLGESREWWWWLGHASSWKGLCHYNRGEFGQALDDCRRMNRIGVEREDPRLQSYSEWNLGWIEATRGDSQAGINHCLRSLQLSPDPLNSAYSTGWLGFAYREHGDSAQAVSHLERAIESLRGFGYTRLVGWFGVWLADAYLRAGRIADARVCAAESLAVSLSAGYPWAVAVGTRALGRLEEADGSPDDAGRLLREALAQFQSIDASFDTAVTRVDLARIAHATGYPAGAKAELSEALNAFESMEAPIYARRAREELDRLNAGSQLLEANEAPLRDRALPLAIQSLGTLQLSHAGAKVGVQEMGGPHGREFFCTLLAARAPVHRDRLVGWLWPAFTADAADEALRAVTLALVGAFGQERVIVESRSHRMVLLTEDSWDVKSLLDLANFPAHDRTVAELQTALTEHAAPPFSEWPDAEWAIQIRRDCAGALRSIRGCLAEALLASDRPDEALPHFAQLAEVDPEQEAWHRGLMRCHARHGDTALALRQYHACRSILRQTRAADPSDETNALYMELLARK